MGAGRSANYLTHTRTHIPGVHITMPAAFWQVCIALLLSCHSNPLPRAVGPFSCVEVPWKKESRWMRRRPFTVAAFCPSSITRTGAANFSFGRIPAFNLFPSFTFSHAKKNKNKNYLRPGRLLPCHALGPAPTSPQTQFPASRLKAKLLIESQTRAPGRANIGGVYRSWSNHFPFRLLN